MDTPDEFSVPLLRSTSAVVNTADGVDPNVAIGGTLSASRLPSPAAGAEYDCYWYIGAYSVACGGVVCTLDDGNDRYDCGGGCFLSAVGEDVGGYYYDVDILGNLVRYTWYLTVYEFGCETVNCGDYDVPEEWDPECEDFDSDSLNPSPPEPTTMNCGQVEFLLGTEVECRLEIRDSVLVQRECDSVIGVV